MGNIITNFVYTDFDLPDNTIELSSELFSSYKKNDMICMFRYPLITYNSFIQINDKNTNIIKSNRSTNEKIIYVSKDIGMKLGIEFNGDLINIIISNKPLCNHYDENGISILKSINNGYMCTNCGQQFEIIDTRDTLVQKYNLSKNYYRVKMANGGSKIVYMCLEKVRYLYGHRGYELIN